MNFLDKFKKLNEVRYLFSLYQKPLLSVANNRFARRFLLDIQPSELPEEKEIIGLWPNVYFTQEGKDKFVGVFRCYPLFLQKLYYAVLLATEYEKAKKFISFERNPALWSNLAPFASLLGSVGLMGILAKTITPLFIGASGDPIFTGSGCAITYKNRNTNMAEARANNADGVTAAANNGQLYYSFSGGWYYVCRKFCPADTTLPAGAIISDVKLGLKPVSVDQTPLNYNICPTTEQDPTTIKVTDHANYTATRWVTGDSVSWTAETYTEFTFNATGRSGINTSGYTQAGPRSASDIDISAPETHALTLYQSAQTGTDKDPYYKITYSTGGTTVIKDFLRPGVIPYPR
jgi:hypothetical protein